MMKKNIINITNYRRAKGQPDDVLPSFPIPSNVQSGSYDSSNRMYYNTGYTARFQRSLQAKRHSLNCELTSIKLHVRSTHFLPLLCIAANL